MNGDEFFVMLSSMIACSGVLSLCICACSRCRPEPRAQFARVTVDPALGVARTLN